MCTQKKIAYIPFFFIFYSIVMAKHSFHECSLRSSSLIIIHKQTQTIVTATDKVFQYLNYNDPHQLLGKSIRVLNPRHFQSNTYLLQCYDHSDKLFQLCVHHDPLNPKTGHLEYWLLKPLNANAEEGHPLSILRLSSYGTIDYAYLSHEFPQAFHDLHGHPIMSYVHPLDVPTLCEKLKQCKIYDTFQIRWLKKHPRFHTQDDEHDDFIWVSFTVIHANYHSRKSRQTDPQTRPICILRPLLDQDTTTTTASTMKDFALCFLSAYLCDTFNTFIESIHTAIDQGKTYLMEYLTFVISSMLTIMSQILVILSENRLDIKSTLMSHMHLLKETMDNYIWSATTITTKKQ